MAITLINRFLKLESLSGIILFVMAIIAMVWANSPLAFIQQVLIERFIFWINEGLMAIFFLVVGLELKRAYLDGQLAKFSQICLPLVGALGGMVIPALIYVSMNFTHPVAIKGWATPVATDIAFALGVLTLFGQRIPVGLKVFLLALAIFDDLGAIIIIALFYSKGISYVWLFQSGVLVAFLCLFNVLSIRAIIPYLLIGIWLWFSLLNSGIHPTIAGVLLALTIPDGFHVHRRVHSPLHHLERILHPWVAYLIIPLFALANAGFSLKMFTLNSLLKPIVLGIIAGLFLGKQLGVFGFSYFLIKLGWAKLPEKATWPALYGVSLLCGIGFTMSLFLGTLAFGQNELYLADVRLGVIVGSILSGLAGALVLATCQTRKKE